MNNNLFPKIEAELDKLNETGGQTEDFKPIGKTFLFDYKTGQHILTDGKLKECTTNEAISQWIEKVLRTEINKYGIYTIDESDGFGISVYEYVGKRKLHMGYVASELKREITEQLLKHRHIESIEDYTAEQINRSLHVTFTAVLITGEKLNKEASIIGL